MRVCKIIVGTGETIKFKWYGKIYSGTLVKAITPDTFLVLLENGTEKVVYSEAVVK